jgi:hypothetical protein
MGKSTICMAIFNSFLYVYQKVHGDFFFWPTIIAISSVSKGFMVILPRKLDQQTQDVP